MSNSGNDIDERFLEPASMVQAAASAAPAVLPAIVKHFSHPFKVRENIDALESAVEKLEAMEGDVLTVKERTAGNPNFPEKTINLWLNQANKVKNEARQIFNQFQHRMRFFHKFLQDYGIGKNAEKKLAEVKDLCSDKNINNFVSHAQTSMPPSPGVKFNVVTKSGREFEIAAHCKKK